MAYPKKYARGASIMPYRVKERREDQSPWDYAVAEMCNILADIAPNRPDLQEALREADEPIVEATHERKV